MIELFDGERVDEVNDKIKLIQKTDGLTFGTDALLLAAYVGCRDLKGLELGSGSGIISFLLLTRGKLSHATALEVQESYATLTERNARLNELEGKMDIINLDLREFRCESDFDIVYTNPPYMTVSGGAANRLSSKNTARHEVMGDIRDFCLCAKRTLKFGGRFLVVYRPDRLTALLSAMSDSSLEAKRITFVHADTDSESSMVLIEGRLGGKCGAKLTPPLIIYTDSSHSEYSSDMNYIMENGSFTPEYKR